MYVFIHTRQGTNTQLHTHSTTHRGVRRATHTRTGCTLPMSVPVYVQAHPAYAYSDTVRPRKQLKANLPFAVPSRAPSLKGGNAFESRSPSRAARSQAPPGAAGRLLRPPGRGERTRAEPPTAGHRLRGAPGEPPAAAVDGRWQQTAGNGRAPQRGGGTGGTAPPGAAFVLFYLILFS